MVEERGVIWEDGRPVNHFPSHREFLMSGVWPSAPKMPLYLCVLLSWSKHRSLNNLGHRECGRVSAQSLLLLPGKGCDKYI